MCVCGACNNKCSCAAAFSTHPTHPPAATPAEAMRYLSYALYPLVAGYAVYALMYQVGVEGRLCQGWVSCPARAGRVTCTGPAAHNRGPVSIAQLPALWTIGLCFRKH